jgi:hypothetical protein
MRGACAQPIFDLIFLCDFFATFARISFDVVLRTFP